ncbi:DUF721 domain-containing protein [Posidoniimonas corsicana]|nr:DUF721 domain-containing protein [Posidoniimonas corsicana]
MDPELVAQKLADLSQRAQREKGRRHARRPKKASDVVAQMFARKGYATPRANEQLRDAWSAAAGPALGKFCQASAVRQGVLEVIVANSMMAQELGFEKNRLLKAMQQALPDARIEGLRFKVGRLG